MRKFIPCSCGSQMKLSKRRNFPFGRKSDATTIVSYVCKDCKKRDFPNKLQEVKR